MSPLHNLLALAGLGLLLGLRHAFEPDHLAAVSTRAAQLAYFVAFAIGTMIGMLAVSVSLAGVVRLAATRGARWATVLHLGSAAVSVTVGVALAGRVASQL